MPQPVALQGPQLKLLVREECLNVRTHAEAKSGDLLIAEWFVMEYIPDDAVVKELSLQVALTRFRP